MSQNTSSIRPYVYTRTLKAPRSLVYLVHTNAEQIAQWFGPAGTKVTKFDMDFRVGGMNHYCLEIAGGMLMWGRQIYRSIVPQQSIEYLQSFSDANAGITAAPMAPSWPREMLATCIFEDDGENTRVTISWLPYQSDDAGNATFDMARPSMEFGFKECSTDWKLICKKFSHKLKVC